MDAPAEHSAFLAQKPGAFDRRQDPPTPPERQAPPELTTPQCGNAGKPPVQEPRPLIRIEPVAPPRLTLPARRQRSPRLFASPKGSQTKHEKALISVFLVKGLQPGVLRSSSSRFG